MTRTLWWPKSALFLTQAPPRCDMRTGRGSSFFAGLILALALLALLHG